MGSGRCGVALPFCFVVLLGSSVGCGFDTLFRSDGNLPRFTNTNVKASVAKTLRNKIPVHQFVEEGFEKLLAVVAVVDIVRVLPYINRQ